MNYDRMRSELCKAGSLIIVFYNFTIGFTIGIW